MTDTIKVAELTTLAGRELEVSSWLEITQERVNQFADATNDHQFIHVDEEKAAKTPFGGTIAHGFLTLSLVSFLTEEKTIRPEGLVMGLNYGSDKVRFLQPVRVGQRIRAHQKILEVTEKSSTNWLFKILVSIEIEDNEKPALIAEILFMYMVR
jgi:acyl dehydratase